VTLSSSTAGGLFDRRAWARKVSLKANGIYIFHLSVPSTADYDLYLYSLGSTSNGTPIIRRSSTNAGAGTDESITYVPKKIETLHLVIKRVSGSGTWTLRQNPFILSFKINGGQSKTSSTKVTLNNKCLGDPIEYMASERPDFAGAVWKPYSTNPTFTLSPLPGTKKVFFKVRNKVGESSVVSDTIELL